MSIYQARQQDTGRGQRLPEGDFVLTIQKLGFKAESNRPSTKGTSFYIAEFKVKAITIQRVWSQKKLQTLTEVPLTYVGDKRSWTGSVKDANSSSAARFGDLLLAASGLTPKEVSAWGEKDWEDLERTALSDANPFEGVDIGCRTEVVMPQSGYPFLVHDFHAMKTRGVLSPTG